MPEAKEPKELKVFANTGHHFFEVPLAELVPDKNLPALQKLIPKFPEPFKAWNPIVPWVRYRYDRTERDQMPIIRIAVESNLGASNRGFLYWVNEHDTQPALEEKNPSYAAQDELELTSFYPDRRLKLEALPGTEIPSNVLVHFMPPAGYQPVDVDLVVDLGNTRTAALLLESPGQENTPLQRRVFRLRVIARGTEFRMASQRAISSLARAGAAQDDCAVFESWLLLHQTLFSHLEPPMSDEKAWVELEEVLAENLGRNIWMERRYMPHAFVELSPALIGGGRSLDGAAKIFAGLSLKNAARFYLSSPKRYVWCNELTGFGGSCFWSQIPNRIYRPNSDELTVKDDFVDLSGLFRYFMEPDDGETPGACDISLEKLKSKNAALSFPTSKPIYPMRDAVCWFGLSLLEAAYRQINSPAYLEATGKPNLPRRLHHVRVTYPAGWTFQERQAYLAQWERAIRLFAMTHFEDPRPIRIEDRREAGQKPSGECPVFEEKHLDEAVCSQLPILYADIRSLHNDANLWINLYGNEGKVVVMNLDIGGGTTDLAIIHYRNLGQEEGSQAASRTVNLRSKLLFRDGHNIAGDMLVKAVIERVLLPAWIKASDKGQYQGMPDAPEWLALLFSNPTFSLVADVDPYAQQRIIRIIRLVFVPLVNELLQRLTFFAESPGSAWEPLDIKACQTAELIDANTLQDLNDLCARVIQQYCKNGPSWKAKVFDDIALIKCKPEDIEACIEGVFSDMFYQLGTLAARFKCQLLIVAGKPSELPHVRQLLERSFPMLPQRIIRVKNFPAGGWYPFADADGRITDAKTCTVVGAALHQDICNGHLQYFSIRDESSESFAQDYYWGVIPASGSMADFYTASNLLFTPEECRAAMKDPNDPNQIYLEKDFVLPLNCRIGRQLLRMRGIRPAPVYKLNWKPTDHGKAEQVMARIRLRWVSIKGQGDKLVLPADGITPLRGSRPVRPEDVRLQLNTLEEECFWMDDPKLVVSRETLFGYKSAKQP